jgi:hypothetical protein
MERALASGLVSGGWGGGSEHFECDAEPLSAQRCNATLIPTANDKSRPLLDDPIFTIDARRQRRNLAFQFTVQRRTFGLSTALEEMVFQTRFWKLFSPCWNCIGENAPTRDVFQSGRTPT